MIIVIINRPSNGPVKFGTRLLRQTFTLMGPLLKLVSAITYAIVDPRIDFESREG